MGKGTRKLLEHVLDGQEAFSIRDAGAPRAWPDGENDVIREGDLANHVDDDTIVFDPDTGTMSATGVAVHNLLTGRDQDVGAAEDPCHPAEAIGPGRLHRNIGTGTMSGNILTMPANANFCRVSVPSGQLDGITSTGFLDNGDAEFFVTNASPTHVVTLMHGSNVSSPACNFNFPPNPGQTTGKSIVLKSPSTVTCWLDLADNCWRLRCLPVGST